jgi:hypothetical protein
VPDLGFFAGSGPGGGQAPGTSPGFGAQAPSGPPSTFGGPPSTFGGPPAASSFGGPASPFGGPPADPPYGAPAWTGSAPAAAPGGGSRWKIAVAAGSVVLLVVLVLAGRFGWQQFGADPVAPASLGGMPKVSGPEVDAMAGQLDAELGQDLTVGSKTAVALYSDGLGTGYLLVAIRGGSRPGSGDDKNTFSSWSETTLDGATCRTSPTAAPNGMTSTICMRTLWRRAVMVVGFSTRTSDPATVARATNAAWDAQ